MKAVEILPSTEQLKEWINIYIFKCQLGGDAIEKQLHEDLVDYIDVRLAGMNDKKTGEIKE